MSLKHTSLKYVHTHILKYFHENITEYNTKKPGFRCNLIYL